MTKKKQRKGRNHGKKDAEKKPRPNIGGDVESIIESNIEMQKHSTILAPLYPLLTALEIFKITIEGDEILEKINMQDYERELEEHFEYSVSFSMPVKEFALIQVAISGTTVRGPKIFDFERQGSITIIQASLPGGAIAFSADFEDESGEIFNKFLTQQDGLSPVPADDGSGNYDFFVNVQNVIIGKQLVNYALECDRKTLLKFVDADQLENLNRYALYAQREASSSVLRQAYVCHMSTGHRRHVLLEVACYAFSFHVRLPNGSSVPYVLHWGTTHVNCDGVPVSWTARIPPIPVKPEHVPNMVFHLSGVPFATGCTPRLIFDGTDIKVNYSNCVCLTLGVANETKAYLLDKFGSDVGLKKLPDSLTIYLSSVQLYAGNEPGLKQRLIILKNFLESGCYGLPSMPKFLSSGASSQLFADYQR